MKTPRPAIEYLTDIIDAMEKIERFIGTLSEEAFRSDDKTVFAVIRGLEIVGEAVKHIPASMRSNHPLIPWRAMAGMRDKLIHDYTIVDMKVVWRTATEDIPTLRPLFQQLYQASQATDDGLP